MSEDTQFSVSRINYIVHRSREIGSNETKRVGVRSAFVLCRCGHAWQADERNGLLSVGGGVHLTCPSCGTSGHVHSKSLGF